MKELEFFEKIVENGYILNDSIKANLLKYLDLVEETNKVMDLTAVSNEVFSKMYANANPNAQTQEQPNDDKKDSDPEIVVE